MYMYCYFVTVCIYVLLFSDFVTVRVVILHSQLEMIYIIRIYFYGSHLRLGPYIT